MSANPLQNYWDDPELRARVVARFIEERAEKERRREAFLASDTFKQMVSALRDSPEPRSADQETAAYFPDQFKKELDWEFATEDDIRLFFNVVGEPMSEHVEPGSKSHDEDCPFANVQFRIYGLNVWMMFGQGTAIVVSNDAALKRSDDNE